jgi:hypothetical protein
MLSLSTPLTIVPAGNDVAPESGIRERVSAMAPTVEMGAVRPLARPSQVRRERVERLSPLRGRASTEAEETSVLISTRDPRSTRYCFVAPRGGRRV